MDKIWLKQQVAKQIYRALRLSINEPPDNIKEIVGYISEDIVNMLETEVIIAKTSGEVISS